MFYDLAKRSFMASIVGLPNLTAKGITEKEAITSRHGYAKDFCYHHHLADSEPKHLAH
jgi:hypothetical protein